MRLTKLGHSCVRLDKDGATLVIDPGGWSGTDPVAGASALLITHEHADHLNGPVVQAALERDPGLELWTTAPVAGQFSGFASRVHVVGHEDAFTAAGFEVHVHGSNHAVIYPDVPVVPNVGFAIDGSIFHPGDAFTLPGEPVETLLLPVSAPWLKTSEMVEYARAVQPRMSYAIHDAILNDNGIGLVGMLAGMLLGGTGEGAYARLEPGASVEL
jgi:L-ascorbate metabolism protein UlaG (beta-lactamase superfamily)